MSQLDDLGTRIRRIAVDPQGVSSGWASAFAPVLRWASWQPKFRAEKLERLRAQLGGEVNIEPLVTLAIDELADNVELAERSVVVYGRLPLIHTAWLERIHTALARAGAAGTVHDVEAARRLAASCDRAMLAPPLTLVENDASPPEAGSQAAPPARVVELQLAAIDRVIEAARHEVSFLGRRRRLLSSARAMLLDAEASLPLDAGSAAERRRHLALEIARIDELESHGVDARIALLHQAKTAHGRGDTHRLHLTLSALDQLGLAAGDAKLAALGSRGARLTSRPVRRYDPRSRDAETVARMYGAHVERAIRSAYESAREAVADPQRVTVDDSLARAYARSGGVEATMAALLHVDGCFEVGAPLVPTRVVEEREQRRIVAHPTQDMVLLRATRPDDLTSAVMTDPRMLILDLAAGRLLARKYLQRETIQIERTQLTGEVRVYLLDGSGSMLWDGKDYARARVRDAILVAEIATMMERLADMRHTRVALFYRYFTREVGELRQVTNREQAESAIADVLGRVRTGGTDIERALLTSFDTIREARASDPVLGKAQIVLITDGEAQVSEDTVREHREALGDIPIAVSVIALGEQNPALRAMVARQRQRGERAFYHFIDDESLVELCRRERPQRVVIEDIGPAVRAELGQLLDELSELDEARQRTLRRAAALDEPTEELTRAYAELEASSSIDEATLARCEAVARDRQAIRTRFERWFPAVKEDSPCFAGPDEIDAVVVMLSTIAEVMNEGNASEIERSADAIEILERLLPDAGITPLRYRALVSADIPAIATALELVREAAG
jgi:hypothetical protein